MATWVQLWDRTANRTVYLLNTHFDHRGRQARTESARLIAQWVHTRPPGAHVIVTGDFNAAPSSQPYQELFSGRAEHRLQDSYRMKQLDEEGAGTFNGFRGLTEGKRIDWIAVSPTFEVVEASVDRTEFKGRYPSDHFPVTASLAYRRMEKEAD